MKRSWKTIVGPALAAARPKSIVEIGSFEGENTRNLLDLCEKTGAVLHVVDPAPRYDVNELGAGYGDRFVFHETLSLNALPKIDEIDAVLIDGDHNWYTVFHELKEIDDRSGEFPLVILHDVFWPFGRRDMYYGPETIPAPYLKPHAPKGVRPGEAGLLEEGGFGQGLEKALEEGGPRNGVLTGVEDFLGDTERELEFLKIPGFHGLGLLFPLRLGKENEPFARFLETWTLPLAVYSHAENLEEAWLESETYRLEVQARTYSLKGQRDHLKGQRDHLKGQGDHLKGQRDHLKGQRDKARQKAARLQKRVAESREKTDRLEKDVEGLRQREQELLEQNANLEGQRQRERDRLVEVTGSRTWRTLDALNRLRLRVLGFGKKA